MAIQRMSKKENGSIMAASSYILVVLLCCMVAFIEICDAASVFDVYRVIQYDLRGIPLGSRRGSLNHYASSGISVPGVDLARTVVIAPLKQVNITLLNGYLQSKRLLGGLLVLLPRTFELIKDDERSKDDEETDEEASVAQLEQWLLHNEIPYPVYFAIEDDKLKTVVEEAKLNDIAGRPATVTTGGYKLVVPVSEPKKLPPPTLTNIQGWLPGLKGEGENSVLPTIAIVAWYDTFGAVPALSVGTDSNGSGVVALLEIARLFSRLYANPKTRGRYNLLFGLTAGGPYNYDGTAKWLKSLDQRLRESIDYALCLNSIGLQSNKLHMHVSKPPDNAFVKQMYDGIAGVAQELGISIHIQHKKINMSSSRVAWEHEQFSRQRITAATISELQTAPGLFEYTGGLPDTGSINAAALSVGIKLLAESLVRQIYSQHTKPINVFVDNSTLSLNLAFVNRWSKLLSRTPRVAPYLSKNAPIVAALQKELSDHVDEASVHHEVLDNDFVFYDGIRAQLSVFQVASVTFDLFIMLAVGTYLTLLFALLFISTRGFDELLAAVRRPTSRKAKAS
ncbi:hypothetical protein O6H91_08G053800 [Diphasiastrum complanatum]|uniref:Uncharacterized protein n=1 Tax=Diphasiastrum complanatum TaxID=34168 RepID=A0ACC2CYK3_DIPCM|nr:hypothetical protein O6H91_08G053800 [Diphasiastrum complanatum]